MAATTTRATAATPSGSVASAPGVGEGESPTARLVYSSRRRLVLTAVLQFGALVVAWLAAVELRLAWNIQSPAGFSPSDLPEATPPLVLTLVAWGVAVLWMSALRWPREAGTWRALLAPAQSAVLASIVLIVVTYFSREHGAGLSRSLVFLFMPLSCASSAAAAYTQKAITPTLKKIWPARERVALFGAGPQFRRVANRVGRGLDAAYQFRGFILCDASSTRQMVPGRVLGTTRQLGEVINREHLDRIVVADQDRVPRRELDTCLEVSRRMGVTVSVAVPAPDLPAHIEFRTYPGLRVIEVKPVQFTRTQEIVKRVFDLLAATACLAVVLPLLALVALLIKITSEGPVLFQAPRVGRGGRHFQFLKFRSMYVTLPPGFSRDLQSGNEKNGHIYKVRQDPRVTPIGRWIRRYSVDELPQLINVIRGDMSLIGPRPLPAQDLDPDGQSHRFHFWSEQRSRVLPGITGLWQVSGRSELTFERMVELDVEYIRNWSLPLDLRILLATPRAVLSGRGAY